jgi:catechol 2,3-dioxygenase-like lactoylglutathione lyase family enzyme
VVVSIKRVVPDISCDRFEESRGFFVNVLGFEVAMDMGWIVTLVSPETPTAQISLFPRGDGPSTAPNITVEVDDVDAVHETAVKLGLDVVYPLVDEEWGVRRFFVTEPSGTIVNVMSHRNGP